VEHRIRHPSPASHHLMRRVNLIIGLASNVGHDE
jgi:hypothetical protein